MACNWRTSELRHRSASKLMTGWYGLGLCLAPCSQLRAWRLQMQEYEAAWQGPMLDPGGSQLQYKPRRRAGCCAVAAAPIILDKKTRGHSMRAQLVAQLHAEGASAGLNQRQP